MRFMLYYKRDEYLHKIYGYQSCGQSITVIYAACIFLYSAELNLCFTMQQYVSNIFALLPKRKEEGHSSYFAS